MCMAGLAVCICCMQYTHMTYMYGVQSFAVYFGHKLVGNIRGYMHCLGVYCCLRVYCEMNFTGNERFRVFVLAIIKAFSGTTMRYVYKLCYVIMSTVAAAASKALALLIEVVNI